MIQKVDVFFQNHYMISALMGVLFALSFAPFGLWPVGLVCLAFLFASISRASTLKSAGKIAFLFLWAHFAISIHWLVRAFYVDFGRWDIAIFFGGLGVLLLSAYLALYGTAAVVLFKRIPVKFQTPMVFSVLWVFFEWIRSFLPKTFSWHLVGYSWAENKFFLQLASVGEVWLMGFVFVFASSLLGLCNRRGLLCSAFLLLVTVIFGVSRLSSFESSSSGVSLLLVQPHIEQTEKWKQNKHALHLKKYFELSRGYPEADIVVWPEMSLLYDIEKQEKVRHIVSHEIGNRWLVLGGIRYGELFGQTVAHNAVFALSPSGDIVDEFDKEYLIPYGEYIPFRRAFPEFAKNLFSHRLDYMPDISDRKINLFGGVQADVLICGESVIPGLLDKDNVGDFVINVTNDAWFENTIGPAQHFAMARVRAAALGKTIVRVGNTGVTAIINGNGLVEREISTKRSGVLYEDNLSI